MSRAAGAPAHLPAQETAPATLVFAWGNPGRGDDALGPLFAERIEALDLPGVECLTDFQLQVEHALDLRGRTRLLFVDAALEPALADAQQGAPAGFCVRPLAAARDKSFSTHSMSPQSLLHVYETVLGGPAPPAWLLAIRGERFELGEALSEAAAHNLEQALDWAKLWLDAGRTPD